jgi:hypothetical protein
MEYLGMKSYYILRGDGFAVFGLTRWGCYETRMLTVVVSLLLYLSDRVVPGWCISLGQLQGTGGTGARANGYKGDHHDGLCSLYDFRTLFHGTSADTKEAGPEVAGLIVHS